MIYLNNTATSFPKPQEVNDAVNESLKNPPCHSSRSGLESDSDDVVYSCRESIAKLFNIDEPHNVVLTSGSTESLNYVINGLNLEGCHVVATEIEHNSVIRPLKTLEEAGEIEVSFAPCDNAGYVSPDRIKELVRSNTKLVIVNHASNVTGSVLDLKAISKIAHEAGAVFAVDASQSAGAIPIDVKEMDIDYLAFTGHKNLFGLPGTGGLYMKEGFSLKPIKVGGTGVLSEILTQPREMPMYYEAGTPNITGITSLKAGVEFVLKTGVDEIASHKAYLVDKMVKELKDLEEVTIYTSYENNSLSNFCFNIEGMTPEEVNYMLESSFDIHVRSGLHCAPLLLNALGVHPWGTVRASPGYFTTEEEADKFIEAIKDIVISFVRRRIKKSSVAK